MIRLDGVGVTYPNGHAALTGVSAELGAGRIVGLVGVNGAGKSTLFKTMMGFIRPTAGSVSIEGRPVAEALKKNRIAYVPQTEEVDWNFPVLARDVVMMGRYGQMGFLRRPSRADHDAVDQALARVDLSGFATRQIGELSGGQKKRVFVARALAQGGSILLLDEPFTGVDIKTEDALTALFRAIAAEGKLIVVSTHNLGSVPRFCDEVMLINQTLLAHGPVATAFTEANLTLAFGGMLRHQLVIGSALHTDDDPRAVTVLTDDERPLVMYDKKIVEDGRE